jgi:hypothetical protein
VSAASQKTLTHRPSLWRAPMTETTSTANNGVNVAALIAAREALTKAPAAPKAVSPCQAVAAKISPRCPDLLWSDG